VVGKRIGSNDGKQEVCFIKEGCELKVNLAACAPVPITWHIDQAAKWSTVNGEKDKAIRFAHVATLVDESLNSWEFSVKKVKLTWEIK